MSNDASPDAFLRDIPSTVKTIAMVGASDMESRLRMAYSAFFSRTIPRNRRQYRPGG
jgi:predicted CoA-binding protein